MAPEHELCVDSLLLSVLNLLHRRSVLKTPLSSQLFALLNLFLLLLNLVLLLLNKLVEVFICNHSLSNRLLEVLSVEVLLDFLLCLVVELLDLRHLFLAENVVVAHLLQEFKQQRLLSLGPSLGNALVQLVVHVRPLHHAPNEILACHRCGCVARRKLRVLYALLSEGKLQHFDSLYQVSIDIFLALELSLELGDALLHLGLLEKPLGLPRTLGTLLILEILDDLAHGDGSCVGLAKEVGRTSLFIWICTWLREILALRRIDRAHFKFESK